MSQEEFDTSELAWIAYKVFYETDFKIRTESNSRRNCKLYVENVEINLSGDTDFNFGQGWSHSRLRKYEGYLHQVPNDYRALYQKQLRKCQVLYKTIVNLSLMPQTGSLQLVKSGLGNDRFDTYIWALNSYYEGETSLLFNRASFQNTAVLKSFFEKFKSDNEDVDSIHIYCEKIYGIPIHSQIVDELILSGKEAIDSPERVIAYMQLAYKFWQHKLNYLRNMFESNRKKLSNEDKIGLIEKEINKIQEILDGWFEQTC